jgi:hypothetical protein
VQSDFKHCSKPQCVPSTSPPTASSSHPSDAQLSHVVDNLFTEEFANCISEPLFLGDAPAYIDSFGSLLNDGNFDFTTTSPEFTAAIPHIDLSLPHCKRP